MPAAHRIPLGATLIATLALLVVALAVLVPSRASAADPPTVTAESATYDRGTGMVTFTLKREGGDTSASLNIYYKTVYRGQGVTSGEGYLIFEANQTILTMTDSYFKTNRVVTAADRTATITVLPPSDASAYESRRIDDPDDDGSGDVSPYTVGDPSSKSARVPGTPGPAPSVPAISVADASATEGLPLGFGVSLHPASDQTVTVNYEIVPRTIKRKVEELVGEEGNQVVQETLHVYAPEEGTDYDGPTSGTVTFQPNETQKTITLTTLDDTVHEEFDEKVMLRLTDPRGLGTGRYIPGTWWIEDGTATGTITDNDPKSAGQTSATTPAIEPTATPRTNSISDGQGTEESEAPTSAATQAPEPTATPRTKRPGKPTILSVTTGSGSITVSWGPADGADGYALHYDRTDVRSDWQVAANAVQGTTHTITDLDPGTYRIRLRAVNERGTSKWAREKRITVR